MKRSLKGMQNSQNMSREEAERIATNLDPYMAKNIGDAINQFSGMSESELMNILKSQFRSGAISPENMDEMAGRLGQMLTPEQRRRMQDIMRNLKN